MTEQAVAAGRLVYLQTEPFEIGVWKQLLYHRNKWISPQMKAVMQHCVEHMFASNPCRAAEAVRMPFFAILQFFNFSEKNA